MRLDNRSELKAPTDLASPAAPADENRKPHAPTGSVWSTDAPEAAGHTAEKYSRPPKPRRRWGFSKLTARVLAINLRP